ncbi:hypothetical protein D3C85_1383830 [compost metagenome]
MQLAAGLVAGAVGFPAGAVAAAVDATKVDFGKARARAPAQQGAGVAGGDLTLAVRDLAVAPGLVQARNRTEQGQAQGIEQGAFAGAGGSGDGKQPGAGQGLAGEVDFHGAGQGGQVLQADGEDFHGCSLSSCTCCTSRAKSSRVCGSTSLP